MTANRASLKDPRPETLTFGAVLRLSDSVSNPGVVPATGDVSQSFPKEECFDTMVAAVEVTNEEGVVRKRGRTHNPLTACCCEEEILLPIAGRSLRIGLAGGCTSATPTAAADANTRAPGHG